METIYRKGHETVATWKERNKNLKGNDVKALHYCGDVLPAVVLSYRGYGWVLVKFKHDGAVLGVRVSELCS